MGLIVSRSLSARCCLLAPLATSLVLGACTRIASDPLDAPSDLGNGPGGDVAAWDEDVKGTDLDVETVDATPLKEYADANLERPADAYRAKDGSDVLDALRGFEGVTGAELEPVPEVDDDSASLGDVDVNDGDMNEVDETETETDADELDAHDAESGADDSGPVDDVDGPDGEATQDADPADADEVIAGSEVVDGEPDVEDAGYTEPDSIDELDGAVADDGDIELDEVEASSDTGATVDDVDSEPVANDAASTEDVAGEVSPAEDVPIPPPFDGLSSVPPSSALPPLLPVCPDGPPCVRWHRTLWIGFADLPEVPLGDDWPPWMKSTTLRAPTAPALAFEERLVVGGGTATPKGMTPELIELDLDGNLVYRSPKWALGKMFLGCIVLVSTDRYLVSEGGTMRPHVMGGVTTVAEKNAEFDALGQGIYSQWNACPAVTTELTRIALPGVDTYEWYPVLEQNSPNSSSWSAGSGTDLSVSVCKDGYLMAAGSMGTIVPIWPICDHPCNVNLPGYYWALPKLHFGATIDSKDLPLTAGMNGKIWGTEKNGFTDWTTGGFFAQAVVGGDGMFYAGDTLGVVYGFDPDGFLVWTFDTGAPVWSSGTVSDAGVLYIANESGRLFALDLVDGHEHWSWQGPGRPSFHSAPLRGGVLYYSSGTELIALQVEPGELAESSWPKSHKDNQNRGNARLINDVPTLDQVPYAPLNPP